ncbi:AMP-binding protein [Spelaeicoccus albus]|uniref:Fatty-acyl-CoA synthase n=1 Tax=Spelaeicoccus albus TaxID=1280376 RepID=A0A7Z0AB28_9MICO|nr:AMP-binding protein [Spelaeicoccus albus]NYI66373.1 fatty-acyl-CoA synthase [Spelaeicoccus albus]
MPLSYSSTTAESPLLGESIGENLESVARRFPDRDAMIDVPSGRRWTYADFDKDVDTLALGLLDLGLEKGDRVGIWAPNLPEWVLVQYATAKIGVILVNVNPAYRTHELKFVIEQSGMRALISAVDAAHSDYRSMATQVAADVPELERVIYIDYGRDDVQADSAISSVMDRGNRKRDSLGADAARQKLAAKLAELDTDDPINIQYTSGTTGFPKGATLSHHNILNNGYFIGELLGYSEIDRVCLPVPFYHCFGMVIGNLATLSHGGAVVLPAASFDAAASLRAVQQEGVTSLYGVPTMFIAELGLADFADYDLSTLRTGVMAGSPCPVEVMKNVIAEMNMSEVAICYGMTETSPVSTMTRVDDTIERRTSTVGQVMPHVEVKVVDPVTGLAVPRGETGELCTRGYSVMLGYWNEPDKTAKTLDAAHWMHTGDLATMDDEGYVNVVGRIKDVVIRGGENVYPREIEEFLYHHPGISDVQVIGVPDEKYGEELMAWIVMRDGADPLDADSLREFCTGKLAHYKIPRYVHIVDDFPMTVSGKIRKVEMREISTEMLGLGAVKTA